MINSLKVSVWITNKCNMNCSYCYESSMVCEDSMSEMTIQDVVFFIKNTCQERLIKNCIVHFHGGEPLLEFERIKYFVSLMNKNIDFETRIRYSITTNGTIINDRIQEFLVSYIHDLSVSIDGLQSSHSKNRIMKNGDDSFEKTIYFMKKMIKLFPNIRARMTVTPNNVKELSENVLYLISSGIKRITPAIDYFSEWSVESARSFKEEIDKLRTILCTNEFSKVKVFYVNEGVIRTSTYCDAGRSNFSIDTRGQLYPCTYNVGDKSHHIGDVVEGVDILSVNTIHSECECIIHECRECVANKSCAANRCKLINKAITNEYGTPIPIMCYTEKVRLNL